MISAVQDSTWWSNVVQGDQDRLIWFNLVQFGSIGSIWFNLVQHSPIWSNMVLYSPKFCTVQWSTVSEWSNMVQSSSMLVQGVHYGLMILNGPVVQYGPILSNGGSWRSWLVPYVCEGLSATCVKADGRLTLCMTCIPIFEDGACSVMVPRPCH